MNRSLFLRLLLGNSLFGCALAAGAIYLNQPIPGVALVAIVAVLSLYALGTVGILREAWKFPEMSPKRLADVEWGVEKFPVVAMLGSLAGFITQDQGTSGLRLVVLASTFVGIACYAALATQWWVLRRETIR